MKYKTYNFDDYNIYTIKTDRFKNAYMEIVFRDDANKINFTKRNFLIYLLSFNSLNYPSKRQMTIAKENVYNPEVSLNISRVGENALTSFAVDFIDPKYINEESYLEDLISFYFDILLNPNRKDGLWEEKSFELIKKQLSVSLNEYKESAQGYAFYESKKKGFPDTLISKRVVGEADELSKISRSDVSKEYEMLLQESICDIKIIGNLDMDKVVKLIRKYYHKSSIVKKDIPSYLNYQIKPKKPLTVKGNYNQTQLIVYYYLKDLTFWEKDYVSNIFMRILGSSSGMNDLLTRYLRVENSLCYYCGCNASVNDLLCTIFVGLQKDNVSLAVSFIDKAIKDVGKIDEEFLTLQKNKFLSDLKMREDSIYGLILNYYFHMIFNLPTYDDYREKIPDITLKDIKALGKKMQKIFEYVLEEK